MRTVYSNAFKEFWNIQRYDGNSAALSCVELGRKVEKSVVILERKALIMKCLN